MPKSTAESGECNNHLQQHFNPDTPNLVLVSDITYLKADGKWYYLCIVMDLFSRKIVGWDLSGKIDTALVINSFQKAYASSKIKLKRLLRREHEPHRNWQHSIFSQSFLCMIRMIKFERR